MQRHLSLQGQKYKHLYKNLQLKMHRCEIGFIDMNVEIWIYKN